MMGSNLKVTKCLIICCYVLNKVKTYFHLSFLLCINFILATYGVHDDVTDGEDK